MKMKKRLSRTLCVLLAALTVLSVAAVATGVGSMEDPLVTLSYLNEKFLPDVMAKVEEKLSGRREELSAALDAQVSEDIAALEEAYSADKESEGESADIVDGFVVVTISKNQTLLGAIGCEMMLRVGSARCVAPSSPGLIDTTAATTIDDTAPLVKNHLYMVTIADRGLKATSDTVKVLVRGAYAVQ